METSVTTPLRDEKAEDFSSKPGSDQRPSQPLICENFRSIFRLDGLLEGREAGAKGSKVETVELTFFLLPPLTLSSSLLPLSSSLSLLYTFQ